MNSKTLRLSAAKHKSLELRRQGKTYSEIQSQLGPIAKGTLSGWLKNVELSETQRARIKQLSVAAGQFGRQRGAWKNHQKRVDRLKAIKEEAIQEYAHYTCNPLFVTGLVLYLAEGNKKTEQFMFMNSDLYLIKLMIEWLTEVLGQAFSDLRFRLYIHELYAHENCEAFWLKTLGAKPEQFQRTIYKPTGRQYKKNPAYKGCLRVEVSGSELYWRTMTWRDCLYRSMG